MFPLTNAIFWLYSLFVNAKSLTGFDSLLVERIPPLSGFFVSGIYFICPLFFLWVDILGSRKARWPQLQSVNPIYPPSRTASTGAVLNRKQRSISHDLS